MARKKNLSPYVAKKDNGRDKIEAKVSNGKSYSTKKQREEARVANRSRKKSARQEGKKEIEKIIDKIWTK